jgi:hypothetical protein
MEAGRGPLPFSKLLCASASRLCCFLYTWRTTFEALEVTDLDWFLRTVGAALRAEVTPAGFVPRAGLHLSMR